MLSYTVVHYSIHNTILYYATLYPGRPGDRPATPGGRPAPRCWENCGAATLPSGRPGGQRPLGSLDYAVNRMDICVSFT